MGTRRAPRPGRFAYRQASPGESRGAKWFRTPSNDDDDDDDDDDDE